jgi:hypothetical protein
MRARILWALAAVPSVVWGQSSFTDARAHRPTDAFAVSACGDAAAREVRSRNPTSSNVHVTDSNASPTADTSTDVSGKGSLRDGAGAIRSFTFRCTYELRKGAASNVMVFL